jgi:hypothetical protein
MDTINVSDDGLREAFNALQSFRDNTQAITNLCTNLLQARKSFIDDTFRKDLMEYADRLTAWNARVYEYTSENQLAIADRMKVLEDYCATTYIKRTF